jgi:hypothetical protein
MRAQQGKWKGFHADSFLLTQRFAERIAALGRDPRKNFFISSAGAPDLP